jgi:group I intron endonuclease
MPGNKYSRGKIYKLVNTVDDNVYVGSTCKSLGVRLSRHKCDARKQPTMRVYQHISKIGWDKVRIVLVENYPCVSVHELTARERHWIETLNAQLNTRIPTRTDAEYREENRQHKRDKQKLYRENNKVMISEKAKEYYEQNKQALLQRRNEKICCECGCMVSKYTIAKHKATTKHQTRMQQMQTET